MRIIFGCAAVAAIFVQALIGMADVVTDYNGLTPERLDTALDSPETTQKYDAPQQTTSALIAARHPYTSRSMMTTTDRTSTPSVSPIDPWRSPVATSQTPSAGVFLGELSKNRFNSESVSNPYGRYGSRYGETIKNPYSVYGSRFSSQSSTNPYATNAPRVYADDGTYLGKLSTNRYDPESISNPYGEYGNKFGNNLMNPYSKYGSKYSAQSWTNPYATKAPKIYSGSSSTYSLP